MTGFATETNAHLTLADENFRLAIRLLDMDSPPPRWVSVVAFYSAVHYISAYFREQHGIAVNSHRHRGRLLSASDQLALVRSSYDLLYLTSLDARYEPEAIISLGWARQLVEAELPAIRHRVIDELKR